MKIGNYFTPKSMEYSGKHQDKKTEVRHFQYNDKEVIETEDYQRKDGYKSYIQVVGLSDTEKINAIEELFDIDELVIEDILNVTQGVKIDIKDTYIFAVVHALLYRDNEYQKEYMSMICLENTVISFHETEPWYLDETINTIQTYEDLRKKTSDFLFYQILDLITDYHIDVYNQLAHVIIDFEDITLNEEILPQEDFYRVRKYFVRLKNNIFYLLDALNGLMKHRQMIHEENIDFYDDLQDHLSRLDGQINLSRENLRNLVDVNINNQSNRMNQIMTTLTLFSAIFIPLSFITGFFGMNFVHFDVLNYRFAIWGLIGFCLLLIGFMIWLFKHKKWL